jgi:hypothetical protein
MRWGEGPKLFDRLRAPQHSWAATTSRRGTRTFSKTASFSAAYSFSKLAIVVRSTEVKGSPRRPPVSLRSRGLWDAVRKLREASPRGLQEARRGGLSQPPGGPEEEAGEGKPSYHAAFKPRSPCSEVAHVRIERGPPFLSQLTRRSHETTKSLNRWPENLSNSTPDIVDVRPLPGTTWPGDDETNSIHLFNWFRVGTLIEVMKYCNPATSRNSRYLIQLVSGPKA